MKIMIFSFNYLYQERYYSIYHSCINGNNTSYTWDTSIVPEGKYQIKINTSDMIDTGTATSGSIYIDHSALTSLTLDIPSNNSIISSEPVQFRFKVTDNVDPVLNCTLILDGASNRTVNANNVS